MQEIGGGVVTFVAYEDKQQKLDRTHITVHPEAGAILANCRWPKDSEGEAVGVGESVTIRISRNELVGLAHDIVSAAARGDI